MSSSARVGNDWGTTVVKELSLWFVRFSRSASICKLCTSRLSVSIQRTSARTSAPGWELIVCHLTNIRSLIIEVSCKIMIFCCFHRGTARWLNYALTAVGGLLCIGPFLAWGAYHQSKGLQAMAAPHCKNSL